LLAVVTALLALQAGAVADSAQIRISYVVFGCRPVRVKFCVLAAVVPANVKVPLTSRSIRNPVSLLELSTQVMLKDVAVTLTGFSPVGGAISACCCVVAETVLFEQVLATLFTAHTR
jgi:hypothetical protein